MSASPAGPLIRELTGADLAWMADREVEIFGPAAWSRAMIDSDFASGLRRYRGIEDGGALVAYMVEGVEADAPHLMNLAVVPAARGKGFARLLVDAFLADAASGGATEAWLEVAANNNTAITLYSSVGFETVRVRRRYYQPEDVDALVMRKRLGSSEGS